MDYIKINRNNSTPLHQQIFICIKNAIQNKHLIPGDKLPTEEELCLFFNISRPVVRQAYNKLIEEELIFRHKGKGSFVLTQKTKYSILHSLQSLSEQITMNNMNPTIKEYLREIIDCPIEYLDKLGYLEPKSVLHIKRMYFGDGNPQFYVEVFLPLDVYPDAIIKLKSDEPIRNYAMNIPGSKSITSKRHMTALRFNSEICERFGIKKGSVGFKIETLSYVSNDRVVEYTIAYLVGLGTRMTVNYF